MASPFTIFRKHQKVLIATLGLLAMIAFVFLSGPVLQTILSGGRSNPLAVSTKRYGDITDADMQGLLLERRTALRFLADVTAETARALEVAATEAVNKAQTASGAAEKATENRETLQRRGTEAWQAAYSARLEARYAQQVAMAYEAQSKEVSEQSVVDAWVLANRAKELGLIVNDDAVETFLKDLTRDCVTGETIGNILAREKLSKRRLFEALRPFLAADQLSQLVGYSLASVPPAERWDYYQRLHRQATIDVIPVPVAKYVDDIPEPDESTLRAFFDQYKDRDANESSPEPGFRRPHQIAVEYVKADLDKFIDPSVVTPEQIRQYYEQFKDQHFLRSQLPKIEEEKPETGKEKPKSAKEESKPKGKPDSTQQPGAKAQPKPGAQQPPEKQPVAPKTPAPQTPKPADVKPGPAEKPAPAKGPEPKGAADKPDAKPDTKKEAKQEAKQEASGKTSSAARPSPFRLVSYLQGDPGAKPAAKPAEAGSKPARKPAQATPKPAEAAPKPAAQPPKAQPAEPAPKSAKPAAKPAKPAAKPAPTSRYIPLEEAKDQIRDTLAREQAKLKIEGILNHLQEQMDQYYNDLIRSIADGTSPPARPPLAELAAKNGLTYHQTGLISQREAEELDIGRSRVGDQGTFPHYAFRARPEFRPAIATDLEGDYYLFWKIEDVPEGVPSFDYTEAEKLEKKAEELRSAGDTEAAAQSAQKAKNARQETSELRRRLVRQWKMIQARSLARDEAKELMAKAEKKEKPLKETFAGETGITVITAGPFTWMTHGSVPATMFQSPPPLEISHVRGVTLPGADFMRTVFTMEPGEVRVAMNQPKTVAYVIRLDKFDRTATRIWEGFVVEPFAKYRDVAIAERQQVQTAWMEELKASIGLKWERKPDQARQR